MDKNPKKEAKMEMLKQLKKMMHEDMYDGMDEEMDKMGKMKKVTVMSDSKEGLEEGLSKAEQILKKKMMDKEDMDMEDMDMEEMMAMMDKEEGDEYGCGGMKKKKK